MYELRGAYSLQAFDEFTRQIEVRPSHCIDLSGTKQAASDIAMAIPRDVASFAELQHYVAFLGCMNDRLRLLYRGQRRHVAPEGLTSLYPALHRDEWKSFRDIPARRRDLFRELNEVGQRVFSICDKLGSPRFRGLRDVPEYGWAIAQHYELHPTPLIDVTSSLHVACSFALDSGRAPEGYLFVLGLPFEGPISINVNDRIILISLQSVCPPIAKRPHYQDGLLVGRYPAEDGLNHSAKVNLANRLICSFRLLNGTNSGFWQGTPYVPLSETALFPERDELRDEFRKVGLSEA